jgi:predicted RNA-binding protein YlqC (UPF0109 family)
VSEDLREFLLFLVQALVDDPDAITLDEELRGQKICYRLVVAEEDKGKIIGKGGRTARALRLLLGAGAAKQGMRAELEIVDD